MDFNRPNIENSTADDIADLKQGRLDAARGFDPAVIEADPSNKPEGMIRWNGAAKKFQKLVSDVWGDLTDVFAIAISGNAGGLNSTGLTQVLQAVYPVGSIYVNASVTTNPATLLGFGTWTAFGAGRVPVGQDTGDATFDTLEETGGSKDAVVVQHTHTASTEGAGAHSHMLGHRRRTASSGNVTAGNEPLAGGQAGSDNTFTNYETSVASAHSHSVTVNSAGVSGTNANLPPFIVVKMWKRVA